MKRPLLLGRHGRAGLSALLVALSLALFATPAFGHAFLVSLLFIVTQHPLDASGIPRFWQA